MSTSAAQAAAFFEEAIAQGEVWTVSDEEGIPAPKNGQGNRAMPFWSLRSRADKVVATVPAYGRMQPMSIKLSDFRQRWLPDLKVEGYHVGINWSGRGATGYDLQPDEVETRFRHLQDPSDEPTSRSDGTAGAAGVPFRGGPDRYRSDMAKPTHQVVVQFPGAAVPDHATLMRSLDVLTEALGDRHILAGHDKGLGVVNIFVDTADRAAVLMDIQYATDWLARPDVLIASRRLQADADYRVLWPQGDKRVFRLSYESADGGAPAADAPEPEAIPFLPLTEGDVPGTRYRHRVHDLGTLRLPSGRLEASDPYVNLGEGPVISVVPGDYPVYVTLADVSEAQDGSHLREAYLSVVLAEVPASFADLLTPDGYPPATADEYYGVGVDSGTVGFADADAIHPSMPDPQVWYDEVFDNDRGDSWFALTDSDHHLIPGCANIVMPRARAGENVVLCRSGWGDGFYPLVGTYDAHGRLVGVHIDLQVDEPPAAAS